MGAEFLDEPEEWNNQTLGCIDGILTKYVSVETVSWCYLNVIREISKDWKWH
jgi:hypothetical protein